MKKLADFLQKKMDEREWTQSDLSRVSGLSRQVINYLMTEKSKEPTKDTVEKLAKAFKIKKDIIYQVLGVVSADPNQDPMIEAIIYETSELPRDEQQEVLEYVRLRKKLAEKRQLGSAGALKESK